MSQKQTVLKAEEAFAREVALGVIVTRPIKSWLYLIPGMFIIDFLRRQSAIRLYVNHYMVPRRTAVKGAAYILQGQDPKKVRQNLALENGRWLAAQGHNHPDLVDVQMTLIEILMFHYARLLKVPSQDYFQMICSAYSDPTELRHLLNRMNEVEFQRDRLMNPAASLGQDRLEATQNQVVMRRNRLMDTLLNHHV